MSSAAAVRPITRADIPKVIELLYSEFRYSEATVTRLFENPDLRMGTAGELPTGFVLEEDGQIIGYHDAFPREIYYKQTPYKALYRGSLYIEKSHLDHAHLPMLFFTELKQDWCDLFVVNSANEQGGRANKAFRFKPGPESCAGVRLRIFSYSRTLLYGTSKSKRLSRVPRPIRTAGCYMLGGFWRLANFFGSGRLPKEKTNLTPRRIDAITDGVFQPFWDELLKTNRGVLTSRRPDVLRWTFNYGLETGRKVILGRFDGEKLRGYIVLRMVTTRDGFPRVRVNDWIAADNDEAVLGDLLRDAVGFVRKEKKGILLQMTGFPESVQPLIRQYLPAYRAKPNAFYYKAKNRELAEHLADSWFFGPYDGDSARI